MFVVPSRFLHDQVSFCSPSGFYGYLHEVVGHMFGFLIKIPTNRDGQARVNAVSI